MKIEMDTLQQYYSMGFSLIPVRANSKKAAVNWKPYQNERATFDQVEEWHRNNPACNWAVVTGKISGITVVDCDSPEALQAAESLGLTNSCCVKTNHGHHFYFAYNDDGKIRKTVSGTGSPGTYWPKIKGLDLRNNGGYALLPPSTGYEWQVEEEDIQDEMTLYQDWPGATFDELKPEPIQHTPSNSSFSEINLTNITLESAAKTKNLTRDKFKEIAAQFPDKRVPRGGSGIHDATYRFLAEEALFVGIGPELKAAGQAFMTDYFESPLVDGRFETSLATVRHKERTNHPERFNTQGEYTYHLANKPIEIPPITKEAPALLEKKIKVITSREAVAFAEDRPQFWQRPWLPKNSIVQVYGYSGHGKSLFVQHALHHAATNLHFGPFARDTEKPKTLYLDFENGKSTLGRRNDTLLKSFGDPLDNLTLWTPWLSDMQLNLREPDGLIGLMELLNQESPDIIVIDTLRSAFPGLKENSAEDWSAINKLALQIRNAGCTVIMLHHSNKPNKDGLGREAGSSNQLTTLETQLRITQVYNDPDMAKTRGGIYAGDLPSNPFIYMQKQAYNATIDMVMEASFGKVREWTDDHDPKQYIGIARRPDGRSVICHSDSPRDRLEKMIRGKRDRNYIIGTLQRPIPVLEEWAEEMKLKLPEH